MERDPKNLGENLPPDTGDTDEAFEKAYGSLSDIENYQSTAWLGAEFKREDLEVRGLSQEKVGEVHAWSKNWIAQFYARYAAVHLKDSNYIELDAHSGSFNVDVLREIHERIGDARYLPEGIMYFFEEAIAFAKSLSESTDPIQRASCYRFADFFADALFSAAGNIVHYVSPKEHLLFATDLSRLHECQSSEFAAVLVRSALSSLRRGELSIDELAGFIVKQPTEEVLDMLHMFETRTHDMDEEGPIIPLCKIVAERTSSQLIRYEVEILHEQLPRTGKVFTYGERPIEDEVRRAEPRTAEQIAQSKRVVSSIIPKAPSYYDEAFWPVAQDAVAIFDGSNFARQIAKYDVEQIGIVSRPQNEQLRTIRQYLEAAYASDELVVELLSWVMKETGKKDEEILTLFGEGCKDVTLEDWKDLIQVARVGGRSKVLFDYGELESKRDSIVRDLLKLLSQFENLLQLPVVEFTSYENVPDSRTFVPEGNERDNGLTLLLQHIHRPRMREKIETDFGISLQDMSIRSQIQFARFLRDADQEMLDRLRVVLGEKRDIAPLLLESFLAYGENESAGKQILAIAEKNNAETAAKVFSTYNEIARKTDEILDYFTRNLGQEAYSSETESRVSRQILKKAHEFLQRNAEQSNVLELEQIQADIILFAATCRALEGSLDLKRMLGARIERKTPGELSEEVKRTMEQVFLDSHKGTYLSDELLASELEDFKQYLKQEAPGEFYLLTHEEKIIAFIRFKEKEDGHVYFGSFNVRRDAESSGIGMAMLKETLLQKSREGKVLDGLCFARNPFLTSWVERAGCVLTGIIPDYKNSGEPVVAMTIDNELAAKLEGQEKDASEVIKESKAYSLGNQEGVAHFVSDMEQYLNKQAMVVSRFMRPKGSNTTFALLEYPNSAKNLKKTA